MRIIKQSFLKAASERHPLAASSLAMWIRVVRAALWKTPADVRRSIRSADPVRVKSGHTVWVFNIQQNNFRLIAAIHFDHARVYTLRFLTHAEYSRDGWKNEL